MALLTNDIYIGSVSTPLYHFTNANLVMNGAKGSFALDVIGNELTIDQLTFGIRWTEDDFYDGFITSDDEVFICANDEEFLVSTHEGATGELKDFLRELPFGTPVWWFVDNEFYAKGYTKSVNRTTKNNFTLTCVSGVGLLDTPMHKGGLYQGVAISTVLSDIIGGAFTFTVSNDVQSVLVYGHLPYDTCRKNLHRLLFAYGAALMKGDDSTDYVIDFLSDTVTTIPASRVSINGSVSYQQPSNRVEITEHAYFYAASAETQTLFDNTNETAADNLTITFDSPVYVASLATTGTLTVSESGVNYAIVSGVGTLTGQYYAHVTQIDVLENNPNNDAVRVRKVEDNELITALNARNVARRVLSFYQSSRTVKAKILAESEKCGNLVKMVDAFGDDLQAYISKMDTVITTLIGAQCSFVDGYIQSANGNNFLHRRIISANGTWTVPAGVTFIRIALIGGGSGGSGGHDGEEGAYKYLGTGPLDPGEEGGEVTRQTVELSPNNYMLYCFFANASQRIPAGGAPGEAGTQGKVYVIERTVAPGEIISFSIGKGGAGGARNGGSGASGTATSASSTSIGSVSSNSGVVSQGYFDPISGDVFATVGRDGFAGGSGGQTDVDSLLGNNGKAGLGGSNIDAFIGGAGGVGIIRMLDFNTKESKASGGGGGGAAYGANGSPGGDAVFTPGHWVTEDYYVGDTITSGAGGDGADAMPFTKPTYGCGGGAGNGGGAGGNCGGVAGFNGGVSTQDHTDYKHQGGAAGKGSVGGDGGDGVAIIYW